MSAQGAACLLQLFADPALELQLGEIMTQAAQAGLDANEKTYRRWINKLVTEGLLVKVEPHTSPLSHCDRCGSTLEPLISKQWFMKMDSLAQAAVKAVESGQVRLLPDNAPAVFYEWMRNIRDWCISRQIW